MFSFVAIIGYTSSASASCPFTKTFGTYVNNITDITQYVDLLNYEYDCGTNESGNPIKYIASPKRPYKVQGGCKLTVTLSVDSTNNCVESGIYENASEQSICNETNTSRLCEESEVANFFIQN